MPGRGHRGSRGNRRGGGRFRINNHKKRKSKGTTNHHRAKQFHDLNDLSGTPDVDMGGKMSMQKMSSRPGRLINEVKYTNDNISNTMNGPLRKRPMEFVKAKQVYDPNDELRKKLESVKLERTSPDIDESMGDKGDAVETVVEEEQKEEEINEENEENAEKEEIKEEKEVEQKEENAEIKEEIKEELKEIKATEQEEEITNQLSDQPAQEEQEAFIIDDSGDESLRPKTLQLAPSPPPNSAQEPLTIGKVSLNTYYENGEMYTELMSQSKLDSIRPGFVDEDDDDDQEEDEEDDPNGYQDYLEQIMKQLQEDTDEYESDTNFDIMADNSPPPSNVNVEPHHMEQMENDHDDDPEYGFLAEDYEFDISKISVSNIRYGVKNQYFIACPELTGTGDSTWVDEDEIIDYVLENGVLEHRLVSFFKFITKGLIDEPESESDVYISELSDEDMDTDDDDDDNLKELLSFSQNHHFDMTREMTTETSSLRTKGKGKKKQLDLDKFDMDNDLRQSLQDQYLSSREMKKLRKIRKQDEIIEQGINSHDLFIKYPYTLHIKDIRNEMESFLHDELRSTLKFPPLDPHGNKTIGKMADCYNFKSKRVGGNGLKSFMEVVKTKRTFNYLPNTNRVYAITRQRPVFNRVDVKRPKVEYLETDGNKDKDRRRQRGKTSNANVKEGELVGEKAPEIPSSNIGRQLLEKMGWSKGEGLGLGKRGINEIVQAKIKTSKLGLK